MLHGEIMRPHDKAGNYSRTASMAAAVTMGNGEKSLPGKEEGRDSRWSNLVNAVLVTCRLQSGAVTADAKQCKHAPLYSLQASTDPCTPMADRRALSTQAFPATHALQIVQ